MIVSFDKLNRFENPEITLCNPDSLINFDAHNNYYISNPVGSLANTKNLSISYNFNSYCEGSFEYSKTNKAENKEYFAQLYNAILKDRYLFIKDFGFVIITNVNDKSEFNLDTKSISFVSCDKELEFCEAPFLTTDETSTNTIEYFIDLWSQMCPMWSVGYVSEDLKKDSDGNNIYRTITEISSEDAYNFLMTEIQKAFDCVVDFDYINRKILIYSQDEYVKISQTDISISKNLLKSLGIEENSDNSYTALEVEGNNELEIRMVNPIGNNIIYNFDGGKWSKMSWMPKDLQGKLKMWYNYVTLYKDEYYKLAPLWYQAQEDFNNMYQDYLVVCQNIALHQQIKDNIKNSSTEINTGYTEAEIDSELEIDYKGGIRAVDISYEMVTGEITEENWDSNKYYAYLTYDEGFRRISSNYDDWKNLGSPTPLYICSNVNATNFSTSAYTYYLDSQGKTPASPTYWESQGGNLYRSYTGLYRFGDFVGNEYDNSDSWEVHDGQLGSNMKLFLEDKKYTLSDEIRLSYSDLKEEINKINSQCSLSTDSGIFTNYDLIRLSNYIKTGKYADNSITITDSMTYEEKAKQAKELMNKAEKKLESAIINSEKISIDAESFIFDRAFSHFTEQLKSGCIISIEVSDNIFEKFHLTNFSVNYEEKTIEFTLGNKYNKFDIKSLFDEVLGDISKSTHQIANLKKRVYKLEKTINNI